MFSDLGSPFREFRLESRPSALVFAVVFALEQAEGFLRAQLGDTGEVLNSETIQNLGSLQPARART